MNSQTEKIQLQGAAGAIAALRDAAAEGVPARGVAVIAHPHPLFGGTMDNKVVPVSYTHLTLPTIYSV